MQSILCLYSCWKSWGVSWGWRRAQRQQDTGQRLHEHEQSEILYSSNEGLGAQWHQRNCSSSSPQRCLLNGGSSALILLSYYSLPCIKSLACHLTLADLCPCFHTYTLPILGLMVLPSPSGRFQVHQAEDGKWACQGILSFHVYPSRVIGVL